MLIVFSLLFKDLCILFCMYEYKYQWSCINSVQQKCLLKICSSSSNPCDELSYLEILHLESLWPFLIYRSLTFFSKNPFLLTENLSL